MYKRTYRGNKADLDFFFGFDATEFANKGTIRYAVEWYNNQPRALVAPCIVKANLWTPRDKMPLDEICNTIFTNLITDQKFATEIQGKDWVYVTVAKAIDEYSEIKKAENIEITKAVLNIPNPKIPEDIFRSRYAHFWIFTKEEYEQMASDNKQLEYKNQLPTVIRNITATYGNTTNHFDVIGRDGTILFTLPPITPASNLLDPSSQQASREIATAYQDFAANQKYDPRRAQIVMSDRMNNIVPEFDQDAKRKYLVESLVLIEKARKYYGLPSIVKKVEQQKETDKSSVDTKEEFSIDDFE